jgi:hypothetical protein
MFSRKESLPIRRKVSFPGKDRGSPSELSTRGKSELRTEVALRLPLDGTKNAEYVNV